MGCESVNSCKGFKGCLKPVNVLISNQQLKFIKSCKTVVQALQIKRNRSRPTTFLLSCLENVPI